MAELTYTLTPVISVLTLALLVLATARIVRLVVDDAVTLPIRLWFANKYGTESMWTYLVHCTWCVAVWVAYPLALLTWLIPEVVIPLVLLPLSVAQVAPMVLSVADRISGESQGGQ